MKQLHVKCMEHGAACGAEEIAERIAEQEVDYGEGRVANE